MATPYPSLASIWLYILEAKQGNDASDVLNGYAKPRLDRRWPTPILDLYMGKISPVALRMVSMSPYPSIQRNHLCEISVYLGFWYQIKGHQSEALSSFNEAANQCTGIDIFQAVAVSEIQLASKRTDSVSKPKQVTTKAVKQRR